MLWFWALNMIHPARYLPRSRLMREIQEWKVIHCMDRIAGLFNTVGDLIRAYERLLHEIEGCQNSVENLCLSPVYLGGTLPYDSPQYEYEWGLHSQHLYYKLVQVKLVEIQLELDQDYYETKGLYKEWKCRNSFFRPSRLSDERVGSAIQVVNDWIEGGQGGKYGITRAFIKESMEYTVDGEKRQVLEDFGEISGVGGFTGLDEL